MDKLHVGLDSFEGAILRDLGDALQIEAVIVGKIIDLGTNLDVNINSIEVKTGEIIASA